MNAPVLNPSLESEVCLKMIKETRAALERAEQMLTCSFLSRDEYCQHFGEAQGLRRLLNDLEQLYARSFRV